MNEIDDKFYYVYSSSLDHKVEIKVGTLEGKRSKPEYDKLLSDPMLKFSGLYQEGCSDLYVTCQVLCDGVPLALPVTTSYKSFTNRWNWNEWVTLPVYYSDLPRNAILAMTIYDCAGPGKLMVVGGTTISLFGKHGMLRQGMFDLRVWPGVEGSEKTPGKAPDRGKEQMQRLAKLAKKHRNGHIPKVDWLDRLTFREIEMINEKEKRSSNYMYLMIEFPTVQIDGIDHAVVYYEQDGDEMYQFRAQAEIVTVPDYEILQLVQALKYEDYMEIHDEYARICGKEVAVYSDSEGKLLQSGHRGSQASLLSTSVIKCLIVYPLYKITVTLVLFSSEPVDASQERLSLASFLITRACHNSVVANYLYWYLLIECEDCDTGARDLAARAMYLAVMRTFSHQLAKGKAELVRTRSFLARQQVFIDKLVALVKRVARESGNRNKKAERLQQFLADPDAFKFNFANFEPVPFPLDPNVNIKGIVARKASLFKSALMPCKLTFLTSEGVEYEAIFKHGDDLRQDQLILQMITLMDKLLRRENLDLKLTPYKVLATSSKHGFLQFIESVTVAEALATEGSIQNFFRKYNPCEGAPYGIKPDTMDTYIRSCAGYCVITYLLGVGDRHLDNLLLTKAGALFHIDFGYILGRDPKPLPPPMKLSKEMVEAMGGVHSEHYHEFRKLCYTAFLHLRRHANLVLNLFSLMTDASVPDIALEPDKAVKKVQDKLRLDLGDEEAVHYLQNLLDMSVTAVMAVLVEQFHKFAQYWRK
ncbi:jg5410 [Pararge aegeria aegeria]|uniref:Phosphatidylinositol 3-kinase catalytic subunit type 3 n=1 Tax=Pararge aegeria aegeria TaxID=348720 RepID=A0A8S4S9Y6_9NEOP|nr:jg5410 [Pararge aegeria aegeria]